MEIERRDAVEQSQLVNVAESRDLRVVQRCDRIAVRGDRELDRLGAEIIHKPGKIRVHPVLAGAQVHRAYRQAPHHRPHLFQRQATDPRRIAITERAREIAFVGQPEAERERLLRRGFMRRLAGL